MIFKSVWREIGGVEEALQVTPNEDWIEEELGDLLFYDGQFEVSCGG
ncbi:hypothetical protein O9929_07395 [Vibrio lentus]|nr:hypothetical protein [Vibrio lentus]